MARFRGAGPWAEKAPAGLPGRREMEAAETGLAAFLREFEHAVRDFEQRGPVRHGPPSEARKMTGLPGSLDDRGSKSISPGSSPNSSEEDLRVSVASSQTPSATAKLGDTRELEAFIADLDQILKEM